MTPKDLEEKATELIRGKVVNFCKLHRENYFMIEFSCGTRLYINAESELDISIT
jgi:hypothetical protein